MDNKQKGIIMTVAAVLLVGCPSCFCMTFGLASALGAGTYDMGASTGQISPIIGLILICVSLIGLLIPVGVGYATLIKK
jgi:purine-cytosine permease-like protein